MIDHPAAELFSGSSSWLAERLSQVRSDGEPASLEDVELDIEGHPTSANINLLPLRSVGGEAMGSMLMIEDISEEKRMKGTMARYMDPLIADSLMHEGANALGGQESEATVLFSDIRGFTTLTESLGAQGTVSLLNAYFSLMVDCLQQEGGILDKFIGDAVMAVFGLPRPGDDDADRAVRTALAMLTSLRGFNHGREQEGLLPIRIGSSPSCSRPWLKPRRLVSIARAVRTARSASSSPGRGRPNTAITASPMNLSRMPPSCCRQSTISEK